MQEGWYSACMCLDPGAPGSRALIRYRPGPIDLGALCPQMPQPSGGYASLPQNMVRVIARQLCTNVCVWHRALVGVTDCEQKERLMHPLWCAGTTALTTATACMIAR